jgi:hypothetical protein
MTSAAADDVEAIVSKLNQGGFVRRTAVLGETLHADDWKPHVVLVVVIRFGLTNRLYPSCVEHGG